MLLYVLYVQVIHALFFEDRLFLNQAVIATETLLNFKIVCFQEILHKYCWQK